MKKGILLLAGFMIWTILIMTIDVEPIGPRGTAVGFAALNGCFHQLTGVHMKLYTITDWLGLVPVAVCMGFGILGLVQWVGRRSLVKVDADILMLGLYYVVVILAYLLFEMIPINYRPILIEGRLEASYPSSTTLLVLSVMPTLIFQVQQRTKSTAARKVVMLTASVFSGFMVAGRLFSGVHWLTDIIGGALLSAGLFYTYKGGVLWWNSMKNYKNLEEKKV